MIGRFNETGSGVFKMRLLETNEASIEFSTPEAKITYHETLAGTNPPRRDTGLRRLLASSLARYLPV
jgi:hypothetical protein